MCSPAATCSASRRPAPARPPRSRCRSCSGSRANRRAADAPGRARADPGADARAGRRRSARASRPTAGIWASRVARCSAASRTRPQIAGASRAASISLVATPGRLLDLIGRAQHRALEHARCWCSTRPTACSTWASSATMRKIVAPAARARQTLLFSATMPPEIAQAGRRDPAQSGRASQSRRAATTVDRVDQRVHPSSRRRNKRALLVELLARPGAERAPSCSRAPSTAPTGWPSISRSAGIEAAAIHGNKTQNARAGALAASRRASVACWSRPTSPPAASTSTTSRTSSTYELPDVPESYVHRIGRTARAGAGGIAISFCDAEERDLSARHREADPAIDSQFQPLRRHDARR